MKVFFNLDESSHSFLLFLLFSVSILMQISLSVVSFADCFGNFRSKQFQNSAVLSFREKNTRSAATLLLGNAH